MDVDGIDFLEEESHMRWWQCEAIYDGQAGNVSTTNVVTCKFLAPNHRVKAEKVARGIVCSMKNVVRIKHLNIRALYRKDFPISNEPEVIVNYSIPRMSLRGLNTMSFIRSAKQNF